MQSPLGAFPFLLLEGLSELTLSRSSRSINFFVYGNGKTFYAQWLNNGKENTAVHLISAATAGSSSFSLSIVLPEFSV